MPQTRHLGPPGEAYSYSNIGFGILGFGLERAVGEPFVDQVGARIFEPLGMTSSTFKVGGDLRPKLARGTPTARLQLSGPSLRVDGRVLSPVYTQAADANVFQDRDKGGPVMDAVVEAGDGRRAAFEVELDETLPDEARPLCSGWRQWRTATGSASPRPSP